MKRILSGLALFSLLVFPALVFGQGAPNVVPDTDVLKVLERIVDWLFSILLIIAAIAIVIAAYYFVTAAGDPEKTTKARNFVIYALIGVIVAFIARGLVALVGRIVGT